jgi:hypothetical protein
VSDAYLREAMPTGVAIRRCPPGRASRRTAEPEDVDAVILFIRSWQQGPSLKLAEKPLKGDARVGSELFDAQCAKCHGSRGIGGSPLQIGNAQLLRSAAQLVADALEVVASGGSRRDTESQRGGSRILILLPAQLRAGLCRRTAGDESGAAPARAGAAQPQGPRPQGFKAYTDA